MAANDFLSCRNRLSLRIKCVSKECKRKKNNARFFKYTFQFDTYCRPNFIESEKPVFNLIQMSHPCIKAIKKNFVPNDTVFENETNIILVTG